MCGCKRVLSEWVTGRCSEVSRGSPDRGYFKWEATGMPYNLERFYNY